MEKVTRRGFLFTVLGIGAIIKTIKPQPQYEFIVFNYNGSGHNKYGEPVVFVNGEKFNFKNTLSVDGENGYAPGVYGLLK